jgi:hypothetical protein
MDMLIGDIKPAWIQALRSGTYKQGRFVLGRAQDDIVYYCSLGVLAEICKIPKSICSIPTPFYHGVFYFNFVDFNAGANEFRLHDLNENFLRACGLSNKEHVDLIGMNDAGKTFEEIADYIANVKT